MMSLILLLVVAVAAFNIVAALVMVVNEKRSDIAILRTLGLPRGGVVGVFLTQGLVIGAIGTLLGVLLGLLRGAATSATIVPVLERLFGFHVMDPTVYYITEIPSEVRAGQVADDRRSSPSRSRCSRRSIRRCAARPPSPPRRCGTNDERRALRAQDRPALPALDAATASCRSSR